jgi:hypothetical protein
VADVVITVLVDWSERSGLDDAISDAEGVEDAVAAVVVPTSEISVLVANDRSVEVASDTVDEAEESDDVAVCAATYWMPNAAKARMMMVTAIIVCEGVIAGGEKSQ